VRLQVTSLLGLCESGEGGFAPDRELVNFVLYNCMRRGDWARAVQVGRHNR
jgi:hypothetical protein